VSFLLAVIILLVAACLRLYAIATLPAGFSPPEITDIRIIESVRQGQVEVFHDLGEEHGREKMYHAAQVAVTAFVGQGTIGYRMLPVWLGMITLAAVYAIGSRLFSRLAGLSAMAIMAFGFWPTLLSRQVVWDTVAPLLVALVLLMLTLGLPVYRRRRSRGANTTLSGTMGVALGLGIYFHVAGLLTLALGLIFVIYVLYLSPHPISRRRRRFINFALLLTVIAAMPYITSSIRHPELSAFNRVSDLYGGGSLEDVAEGVLAVGFAGDASPLNNLPSRPLYDPLTALVMLAGVVVTVRGWRQHRYMLMLMATAVLGMAAVLAPRAPNFLAFAPVLPVLALLFGVGVRGLVRMLKPQQRRYVYGPLLALLVFNLGWTARDLFWTWPHSDDVELAYNAQLGRLAHYVDISAGGRTPTIICGWSPEPLTGNGPLTDAQMIAIMLNRSHPNVRYANCGTGLVLTDGGRYQRIILPDPKLRYTAHPSVRRWLSYGEPIDVGGTRPGSVLGLEVVKLLAIRLGNFTVSTPVSYAPEVGGGEQFGPPVSFGGNLTFLGYVTDPEFVYEPGSMLTLVTYWRADGVVPPDLRLFTHVLADPGASPPANRDTISVWPGRLTDRDVFVQVTQVMLPESIPPGEYRISIGAYQSTSDIRLNALDQGQPRGDRLFLYTIRVRDAQAEAESTG
jgi:4-amino-4-deoxy-L-arabinose transferase-like glycosyltransferase